MTPYQQNTNQLEMYWSQSINTEHCIQPQQSTYVVSPVQSSHGTSMQPVSLSNSMINHSSLSSSRFGSSSVCPVKVMPNGSYCSNLLAQLVGGYQAETREATFIHVELDNGKTQYAKVKRTCASGAPLPNLVIREDDTRFALCSFDGFVLAVMIKSQIIKHSVTWYTNEGSKIVWRRTGDVYSKWASSTPEQSRRNSLTSVLSGVSLISYSSILPYEEPVCRRMQIRQESHTRPEEEAATGDTTKSTADSSHSTSLIPISQSTSESRKTGQRLSDDALFSQFKEYCGKFPSLLQKIIHWGISRTNRPIGTSEISALAAGRVWVRATVTEGDVENWQEILDEFKGAYQEVAEGVFLQPPAQPNEPGIQHRLRQNELGFWIIEELNAVQNVWYPCAQELPYGNWVDLKDNRKRYNIQVLSFESILYRMRDQWADFGEMRRSVDFLFNLCNQKKLNTRLKARNLKHNISSLKLKLEKQHTLLFAVRISQTADSIAIEGQDVCLDGN